MFRGKKSSNNRNILISSTVIEFWCFGLPVALGRGQVGGGCLRTSGGMGDVTTCTHMHAHAHKHMYKNCKWPPTWRHPCLSCLTCMCVCACMCMHAHVCMCTWDTTLHTHIGPHPIHTSATPWGDPGIGQNSITLELIKIFQLCLKI